MVKTEYEVFLKLGGTLDFQDLLDDKFDEIRSCSSFQDIDSASPQRQLVLEKVALTSLAQDQAFILGLIVKAKQALQEGDLVKAKFFLDCIFH